MKLMSAKEASKKWGITQRRVSTLCSTGRIAGAETVGNMWVIPAEAKRPADGRMTRNLPAGAQIRPFIKWAGGKGQLLEEIRQEYPEELGLTIKKYAEPFVGGGAVLFDILSSFELDQVYISDVNRELINTYQAIKTDCPALISLLEQMQKEYQPADEETRKPIYYAKRERYNELKSNGEEPSTELAALFIYLNKTCFNGLYRVNSKNLFNVPKGVYKNPLICDEKNLRDISEKLQNVTIVCGNYRDSAAFIDADTFVYFDPPYRPLTATASFTSYTEGQFNDDDQRDLAAYVKQLSEKGAKVAVSNSDPKNTDPNDDFFDDLYAGLNIRRIQANRMINSNGEKRGKISELLITNY